MGGVIAGVGEVMFFLGVLSVHDERWRQTISIAVMEILFLFFIFVHISRCLLLRLLHLPPPICGLTKQPHNHKRTPSQHGGPNTDDPRPRRTNLKTPRPLIMGKMSDGDVYLLIHDRQERALVVYTEGEDAVLIWDFEGGAVGCGGWGVGDGV